jgi:hypothetical protein
LFLALAGSVEGFRLFFEYLPVPHDLEPLQAAGLAFADAGFLFRDRELFVDGVHAVKVRQQQAAPVTARDDHAVTLSVEQLL